MRASTPLIANRKTNLLETKKQSRKEIGEKTRGGGGCLGNHIKIDHSRMKAFLLYRFNKVSKNVLS